MSLSSACTGHDVAAIFALQTQTSVITLNGSITVDVEITDDVVHVCSRQVLLLNIELQVS